jgi:DNA-binding transcriptional MerR regulator
MSDPLSIAGSAVGIISLGLQVCGEIVSYCQSWRGFDEDIQRITEKADALRMPLKQLRELIEDTQRTNPADASDLEEKTQSLQQAIMRLKAARDRYSSTNSVSPNGFRYQVKKAKYPFKKDGLREMCSDLDSIQLVLQTTLQM